MTNKEVIRYWITITLFFIVGFVIGLWVWNLGYKTTTIPFYAIGILLGMTFAFLYFFVEFSSR